MLTIPKLCDDPDFQVKIAQTAEELEQAYRLLHNCYVRKGLTEPTASGLRCTFFSCLPVTTVVVAMYKSKVVGTVTLIKDSGHGLPSDKEFAGENAELRKQGHKLLEVSALAVSPDFRNTSHTVSLLLMKYLYNYSSLADTDCLVCTIHPRAQDFYETLWGFRSNGRVVQYPFVNGALAVHSYLDLKAPYWNKVIASFDTTRVDKNTALWVMMKDDRFQYPIRQLGQVSDPVLTPQLLEYFFLEKTKLFSELLDYEKSVIVQTYTHYYGAKALQKFEQQLGNSDLREHRAEVAVTATVTHAGRHEICKMMNVSSGGAFLQLPRHLELTAGETLRIRFKLGQKQCTSEATVAWIRPEAVLSGPAGIGIQFSKPQSAVAMETKSFLWTGT